MHQFHQSYFFTHLLMIAVLLCTLSACGDGESSKKASGSMLDLFDAATGPLEDLNLKQKEIPPLLEALLANPYAAPKPMQCKTIRQEMAQLDTLLGKSPIGGHESSNILNASLENIENIEIPDTETVITAGQDMAHDGVIGFIRNQTNILPFRSIIRTITGADAHERKVALAFQVGQLRRAYLQGVADHRFGKRCLAPAVIVEASTKRS
jgi:hypothetical protein